MREMFVQGKPISFSAGWQRYSNEPYEFDGECIPVVKRWQPPRLLPPAEIRGRSVISARLVDLNSRTPEDMDSPYVLVAVRPEDHALVSSVLEGFFDFTVCHTLREAVARLDEPINLIVCGVHFDHGAMFDLLAAAKSHPNTNSVPFLLVLREESSHSANIIEGIRRAAAVRGVDAFLDLRELRADMSEQQMLDHLRRRMRQVLSGQD